MAGRVEDDVTCSLLTGFETMQTKQMWPLVLQLRKAQVLVKVSAVRRQTTVSVWLVRLLLSAPSCPKLSVEQLDSKDAFFAP